MNKTILTVCLLVLSLLSAKAQLAMGKWRIHLAYNSVSKLTQSDNKVYAVSDGALFSVDKTDGNIEYYSKLSGLNSSGIAQISFDATSKQLLIVYSNGNIDLMTSSGIKNIPDLYNNIAVTKTVNNISIYQDKAYLAMNFGIIAVNLTKKEIADTYYIGTNGSEVKVVATTVNDGYIYAASASELYMASVSDPNLVNYQYWSKITNLPGSGDIQNIGTLNNNLILLRNGQLLRKTTNGSWTDIQPGISFSAFSCTNGLLIASSGQTIYLFDQNFSATSIATGFSSSDFQYDSTGLLWAAAQSAGVVSINPKDPTNSRNYFKPDGPAQNSPWKMVFSNNKLYMVPGGRWSIFYNKPGTVMIKGTNWMNLSNSDIEAKTGIDCRDLVSIAVDPKDDTHFYAASYSSGLYEFRNNAFFKYHNFTNSTIEGISNNYNYQMLDGTVFDTIGNLWFVNSYATKSIKVLRHTGEWAQLDFANFRNVPTIQDILISKLNQNQKWIVSCRPPVGVFVFDDNGTITDQSDDKSVFLTSFAYPETDSNGQTVAKGITPGALYSIAQDKNGVIWVGTEQGPFLFQNLSNVFGSGYTCSRVKIPRNDGTNLADYLLANEKIKAIAIDGANRKWIGTESSGVYLMSENGQTTIKHFTTSNSPLLSNSIMSLAIHPTSGEVFIGTDKGLVSYQSDAADASDNFGDVHAYPNPVRPGFSGIITITGLIDKTQVKITDINGNLVCQTVSNGSIATWDGKDVHGRKVNTGIYLAMCVNEDGTKSTICKIMVIN